MDISCPLAVMADHDLIYSEMRGHMKGLALFIALAKCRALSCKNLSLIKITPVVGNNSLVGLSHFSLYIHLKALFWIL